MAAAATFSRDGGSRRYFLRVNLVQRKLLMGGLVAAFAVQTALVYTDDTASSFEILGEEALRGRQLWHEYNCQTCHQIHGFGGFLGPDLTNAAKRLTDERLQEVLTVGTAQMPAFHFDEDQVLDLAAFLDELSVMGIGVPRAVRPMEAGEVLAVVEQCLAEAAPGEAVVRGTSASRNWRKNARSSSVLWAPGSFSTESLTLKGPATLSPKALKPSLSPPGPAKRSTMGMASEFLVTVITAQTWRTWSIRLNIAFPAATDASIPLDRSCGRRPNSRYVPLPPRKGRESRRPVTAKLTPPAGV